MTTALVVQPLSVPGAEPPPLAPAPAARRARADRLAAIDVGSNSIHMIVVAPERSGGYRVLGREREMVRLGKSALSRGALSEPSLADRRDLILGHFRLVAERESSKYALHKLRKFTGWYTHGLPNGRRLRQSIQQLPDVASFLAAVEVFFDEVLEQAA